MQKRPLGRTGEELSVVGFGGLMLKGACPADARAWVDRAVARGVRYFDVGPSYGDSEVRLGEALEPHRRDVFLACKTLERTREGARKELEESLERLRTNRFDLYQHHAVNRPDELERIFAAGGAMETFLEAREEGLVRFLGFSSHVEKTALALIDRFEFDSVLFPINWVCWLTDGFGSRVVARAEEKGMGILALKALARRKTGPGETRPCPNCWYVPVDLPEEARRAMRFTLSQPVTAAVSPANVDRLWLACDAVEDLAPLTDVEREEMRQQSRDLDPIFPN